MIRDNVQENMSTHIPVIDFDELLNKNDVLDNALLKKIGNKLIDAFTSVGFCYITNHGVEEELIQRYFDVSRTFFTMPSDVKQKYSRLHYDGSFGWLAADTEVVNPNRPASLRESFNFVPQTDNGNWEPNVKGFQVTSHLMIEKCSRLSNKVLECLSIGLGLDRNFLCSQHKHLAQKGNTTCLKPSYYTPILPDSNIKPGHIRLGEHSDYGTITILFQDDIGGLEVEVPGVGYIPASPIPGTVVVNIGDLMERWTADKLVATKHRVIIPEQELAKRSSRQSVAFFVQPDDDAIITCLDGSNKYEPITALDYLKYKLSQIY